MAVIRCLGQALLYGAALVAVVQGFSTERYQFAQEAKGPLTIHWKYAQGEFNYTKWNIKM